MAFGLSRVVVDRAGIYPSDHPRVIILPLTGAREPLFVVPASLKVSSRGDSTRGIRVGLPISHDRDTGLLLLSLNEPAYRAEETH